MVNKDIADKKASVKNKSTNKTTIKKKKTTETRKNLVIVESPTKVATIKKYLGRNYEVMSTKGHIRDLPKSTIGVDIENDFEPKYIPIRGKGDVIRDLKKAAKKANKIFLATDPDREGEAIAWHLAYILGLDVNDNIRVSFNEITKDVVVNGIKQARKIDTDLVDAQQARRVLDRIVGYKLSPFLWKKVKKGLSAGRVQSVATKLVVDKEREISAFIPEEYWELSADLLNKKNEGFTAKFYGDKDNKIKVTSKQQSDAILKNLDKAAYIVDKITKGKRKIKPSPPFTTSTLQQDALRKLNFQVRRTMQVAQELYEGVNIKGNGTVGLITYMRTDSLRISDVARAEAKEVIINKYGSEYYPESPRIYKSKQQAQDAHEAIRPTSLEYVPDEIKDNLTKDQYKVYKMIYTRFLASQMSDQILNTISAPISAGIYIFKASGYTIDFYGFAKVYETIGDDNKKVSKKEKLPELYEGEKLKLKKLDSVQKFTQPPARYSEASLIKTLEENGIGRPSTYAPTITTILARKYVSRKEKSLIPTELGEIITKLLEDYFSKVVDVDFTAEMETKFDDVSKGESQWKKIIEEFYSPFNVTLKKAEEELGDMSFKIPDVESDVVCDLCGRKMVIKSGRFGDFLACPGYPECKNTKQIVKETKGFCPECGGKMICRKSKSGKIYFACDNYPECKFMSWDEPIEDKCPKCGKNLAKKSRSKNKIVCLNPECDYEEMRENGTDEKGS